MPLSHQNLLEEAQGMHKTRIDFQRKTQAHQSLASKNTTRRFDYSELIRHGLLTSHRYCV